ADSVKIRLYEKDRYLHLHLRDNGEGFDVKEDKKASYGLRTMQERCDEIGGRLNVTSRKKAGTVIDVQVPIAERGE
ncbi:MAG TPA: ATP-binding protein, partial [Bacillales bacterium]|nr:ATP-binding protein [Bacillales bacterium]